MQSTKQVQVKNNALSQKRPPEIKETQRTGKSHFREKAVRNKKIHSPLCVFIKQALQYCPSSRLNPITDNGVWLPPMDWGSEHREAVVQGQSS